MPGQRWPVAGADSAGTASLSALSHWDSNARTRLCFKIGNPVRQCRQTGSAGTASLLLPSFPPS